MKAGLLLSLYLGLGLCSFSMHAQESQAKKDHSFYFYWGYNRSTYSKTNIHFNGPNYDFTLYDVRGEDRPSPFGIKYFGPTTFSIPQYNFRLGYFISDRIAISIGSDHMKYIVIPNQETIISGIITPDASTQYAGTYLNESIRLEPSLLQFEHSDGFNLASIDLEYLLPFSKNPDAKWSLDWNFGMGGIWVVTKTKVKVLLDGLDNDFHVAGYSLFGKTGPRISFRNKVFLLGELKGGYASLPSVLIKNAEPEIGDHNLLFLEYYLALGVNFSFNREKKN